MRAHITEDILDSIVGSLIIEMDTDCEIEIIFATEEEDPPLTEGEVVIKEVEANPLRAR